MPSYITGITVQQLIIELEKMDPASPVAVEGCDCYGVCTGLDTFVSEGYTVVLVSREEG